MRLHSFFTIFLLLCICFCTFQSNVQGGPRKITTQYETYKELRKDTIKKNITQVEKIGAFCLTKKDIVEILKLLDRSLFRVLPKQKITICIGANNKPGFGSYNGKKKILSFPKINRENVLKTRNISHDYKSYFSSIVVHEFAHIIDDISMDILQRKEMAKVWVKQLRNDSQFRSLFYKMSSRYLSYEDHYHLKRFGYFDTLEFFEEYSFRLHQLRKLRSHILYYDEGGGKYCNEFDYKTLLDLYWYRLFSEIWARKFQSLILERKNHWNITYFPIYNSDLRAFSCIRQNGVYIFRGHIHKYLSIPIQIPTYTNNDIHALFKWKLIR